jgi:catechol-2,3-dioxygenase
MSSLIGQRHVGWGVKDPVALAAFYRDVMGMSVVRQTPADAPIGTTVFLSHQLNDEEDHDLVFFSSPMFAHTAFRVASLEELRTFYRQIKERGVPIKNTFNHGLALSIYFDDPEGHTIEIYWLTHVRPTQDQNFYALPIDLDLPEEELLRAVERVTGQAPSTSS